MLRLVIIGQGSQLIQLIREIFSLGIAPDSLRVLTIEGDFNLSCLEFLRYYKIKYDFCNKENFNENLHSIINNFSPKIVISFSNPFIISKNNLCLQTKFINFHPGILPNYKGSLSTVHSMINNEKYVGGTWHYIDKGIDTGNIIKKVKTKINNFNAFTLNHKIFSMGISCLSEIIQKVINNYEGKIQMNKGVYFSKEFPNIDHLDIELQEKILYFPPFFDKVKIKV